jgi:hypothetical protein
VAEECIGTQLSAPVPNRGYRKARWYRDPNVPPDLSKLLDPWQQVTVNGSEKLLKTNPTVG